MRFGLTNEIATVNESLRQRSQIFREPRPHHLSIGPLGLGEALALHFPIINQIDGKLGHLSSIGKSELIFDVSLMRLDCFHAQTQSLSD
jgi:hypothetical protein